MSEFKVPNGNLGEGAFGVCKLCQHKQLGTKVAIKAYAKKSLKKEENIMAIHKEIHILSQLEHPNISELYEVIDTEEQCCLIMELCEGRNLFQYVRQRPK